MSEPKPDRLEAFKRWQSSELEDARIKRTQCDALVAERLTTVESLEADIASLQSLARAQADSSQSLRPETLLRMNEFGKFQQQQLESARDAHRQAEVQAEDAQRSVLQLFEHLSVVQRLLDRRQGAADKQEQRSLQKQLDEGALSRVPAAPDDTTTSEDTSHGR